jgi:Rieske Fe-S protein
MKRREFTKICSTMVAAATGAVPVAFATEKQSYNKSRLFSDGKDQLTASTLTVGEPYVFFYPYISTPCFLIDLGEPAVQSELVEKNGNSYEWTGGVGPENSIVAYSAICSHKMSHPAKEISFINYRHDPITFYSREGKSEQRAQLISCCSERSVYDPMDGARVLGGPAPQPLAAIALEYDSATGELYATGSYGGDMYDRFFDKFGFRAAMEHKVNDPRRLTGDKTALQKLSDYSGQTIKC